MLAEACPEGQGMQENQQLLFMTDGGENVRRSKHICICSANI
jgi:hypothetical protein